MTPSWQVWGHTAHLVLEDADGELFEVRTPVKVMSGELVIDTARVVQAVDARTMEKINRTTTKWPVY